jgi:hypothetical protein
VNVPRIFPYLIVTALILSVLGLASAAAAPNHVPSQELPLGPPSLKETRTTQEVAPGITYTRIERGHQSKQDFYTVDVAFTADSSA